MKKSNASWKLALGVLIVLSLAFGIILSKSNDANNNTKYDTGNIKTNIPKVAYESESTRIAASPSIFVEPNNDGTAVQELGKYISLDQYNQDKSKYVEYKKVYFFHASWCSICQGIDKELTSDPSIIPPKSVIIKTDFDKETELRKKYGVTYQYTFVQIDNNENELTQWSAVSAEKAVSKIQ